MVPYQYRPLNEAKEELRLIKLQPASCGDRIKLCMQHVPLCESHQAGTAPGTLTEVQKTLPPGWTVYETLEGRYLFESNTGTYCSWAHPDDSIAKTTYSLNGTDINQKYAFEALSYTWGNDVATTSIQIVDLDVRKAGDLVIRPNLATALRSLRHADKERTLWIDAICIDQSNLEERGRQVKRMDQIYRLAKQVIVWLGGESEEENSDRAMELLEYIGAQVEYTKDQSYLEAPSCQEKNWHHPDVEIPLTDLEAVAIRSLLERPWFSRLWIWQEVQLANTSARLYCGHKSITWYHFRRAVLALDVKQQINALLPVILAQVSSLVFSRRGTASLKLLWATRHAQCHDNRDRIYAILGLLQPRFSSLVEPDYGMTSTMTYQRACQSWMKAYDKLNFFEFCDMRQGDRRPSWVPDWSKNLSHEPMIFSRFASGNSGTGGAQTIDDKLLEVFGVVCGVTEWVEEVDLRAGQGFWEHWRSLQKELHTCEENQTTNEAHLGAFVAMLCGNRIREMYPSHIYWPTLAECRETFLAANDRDANGSESGFNAFENNVHEFTNGRRLFRTQEYLGVAPLLAAKGDMIAVLLGFDAPVILRSQANGHYAIIGEAYVHGLMNGEAILGPIPTGWRVQSDRSKQGLMIQTFTQEQSPAEPTCEDPRLGPLPAGWEITCTEMLQSPSFKKLFKSPDEIIHAENDPRVLPKALALRGIKIQKFQLC